MKFTKELTKTEVQELVYLMAEKLNVHISYDYNTGVYDTVEDKYIIYFSGTSSLDLSGWTICENESTKTIDYDCWVYNDDKSYTRDQLDSSIKKLSKSLKSVGISNDNIIKLIEFVSYFEE